MFPPGTHPDGDPFAAQDEARLANSALGRMQARAQHEDAVRAALQAGLPPPPSPAGSVASLRSSSRSTTSVYGSKKAVVETVVLNDTSDDDDDDTQVQNQIVQQRAKPTASASASSSKRVRAASHAEMVDDGPKPVVPASSPPRAALSESTDATATATAPEPTNQPRESSLSSVATSPAPNRIATPPPGPPEAVAPVVVAPVKRQQHRSPSPVILPPRPPPRTVRLSIQIPRPAPGDDVPEFSVADLARDAGFLDEEDYAQDGSGSASGGSGDDSGDSDDDADEGSSKKKDKGKVGDQGDTDKMEGVESTAPAPATGDANGTDAEGRPKKRQRKAKEILGRLGGYDTEDPFVDDTELALYEPIYYHRPKREGYYVCSGPLEVISDAKGPTRGRQPGSKNKPKYDAEGNLMPTTRKPKVVPGAGGAPVAPVASTSKAPAVAAAPKSRKAVAKDTAKSAPVVVPGVLPSVSSVPTFGDGSNLPVAAAVKKKEPGAGFSPELLVEIEMLKAEIAKESFEVKNKFPPRLRPILVDVALRALDLGEYDDDFYAILPHLFPYNLFTMKKLVKREIFPHRLERIDSEQASHMRVIERGVAELLDGQRAEFDALHRKWEIEHSLAEGLRLAEELRKKASLDKDNGAPGPGASTSAAAAVPTSDAPTIAGEDTTMGSPGPEGEDTPGDEAREPKWKFKFNEPMRLALYHLYRLEDERSELTTEKQNLEKATEREGPLKEKPYSALQAKRAMYARVAALWPEDLMTTNQLSREMSITKKKVEKDTAAA